MNVGISVRKVNDLKASGNVRAGSIFKQSDDHFQRYGAPVCSIMNK